MKTRNPVKYGRQKKFYTILPVIAIPFIILIFSVLGGGKSPVQATEKKTGFNFSLPDAKLKDDAGFNKLSYYEAVKDSAQATNTKPTDFVGSMSYDPSPDAASAQTSVYGLNSSDMSPDNAERQVNAKLEALNKSLNDYRGDGYTAQPSLKGIDRGTDVQHLQTILNDNNASPREGDPELDELNKMMDKILDIQHPERIKEKIKIESEQKQQNVYPVILPTQTSKVTALRAGTPGRDKTDSIQRNHFHSVGVPQPLQALQNTVEAATSETQVITTGSSLKLRVANDLYVSGVWVSKGTMIFGTCTIVNDRVDVQISNIRCQNNILPVNLKAYDMDGIAGIYVPGTIARDVAKQSTDQTIQGIDLGTYNTSIGAQAASAGITAAKTLFSRKVKAIKMTIPAGYRVLLKDEHNK